MWRFHKQTKNSISIWIVFFFAQVSDEISQVKYERERDREIGGSREEWKCFRKGGVARKIICPLTNLSPFHTSMQVFTTTGRFSASNKTGGKKSGRGPEVWDASRLQLHFKWAQNQSKTTGGVTWWLACGTRAKRKHVQTKSFRDPDRTRNEKYWEKCHERREGKGKADGSTMSTAGSYWVLRNVFTQHLVYVQLAQHGSPFTHLYTMSLTC